MPIYEFQCKSCNAHFEMLVSRSQNEFECPHCESSQVERQLSTFGVSSRSSDSCGMEDPCLGGSCGAPAPGASCGKTGCPLN